MKKLKMVLLLPLAALLLLPGCGSGIEYSKTITNQSDEIITVAFTCCGQESEKSFEIQPWETVVVHQCIYQGPGQVPDCNENPMDFQLFGNDGNPLEAQIQDSRYWDYHREEKEINCNFIYSPTVNSTKSTDK